MDMQTATNIVIDEAVSSACTSSFHDRDTAFRLATALTKLTGNTFSVYGKIRFSGPKEDIETRTWHIECV